MRQYYNPYANFFIFVPSHVVTIFNMLSVLNKSRLVLLPLS